MEEACCWQSSSSKAAAEEEAVAEAEAEETHKNKSSPSSEAATRAYKLLYRNLRVGVLDGRVFVGKLHCLDKQGNIILYDAIEYRPVKKHSPSNSSSSASSSSSSSSSSLSTFSYEGMEQRNLGLILISAKVRTSCHVQCNPEEQLSLLSLDDDSSSS